MADAAKLLVSPMLLPTSSTALYTTPASTTTIIRNIHISNSSTGALTFTLGIGTSAAAGSVVTSIYYQLTIPGQTAFDWSGFLVLPAGIVLAGLASNASNMTICVSGVEAS